AWAVVEALAACQARLEDVVAVASIDLKADEPGLQALARWQGCLRHKPHSRAGDRCVGVRCLRHRSTTRFAQQHSLTGCAQVLQPWNLPINVQTGAVHLK
ncbi:MAG: cobalamin biosynthesis protein, partial [Xylophilus sp.]|nr:cobalamin biosynthesis protein [Xylophilus sp.]